MACLSLAACGDDGGGSDTDSTNDSTGPASSTGTSTDPSEGTTTDAATSDAPMTTGAETTDPGTTDDPTDPTDEPIGDCQVWAVTYDLTGSTFEISDTPADAGDQLNTVQEPYDADSNIGPGSFVLYFDDNDGAPGAQATMVSYEMGIHFVVGGLVTVTTDMDASAGPDVCGLTQGNLADGTLVWNPAAIVGHESVGQVECTGSLCTAGGLPDGEPVMMNETTDQPLNPFVFSDDLSTFTMASVVIGMDENSTNTWTYSGTETNRELIDAPACLCE